MLLDAIKGAVAAGSSTIIGAAFLGVALNPLSWGIGAVVGGVMLARIRNKKERQITRTN